MSQVSVACFCLALFSVGLQSQSAAQPSLRLTATIVEERYCEPGDAEASVMRLKLRLRYTNTSTRAVILRKEATTLFRALVSRNTDDAMAGRHEVQYEPHYMFGEPQKKIYYGHKPDRNFVILDPGKEFQTEAWVWIVVRIATAQRPTPDLVSPGDHVLQVLMGAFFESRKTEDALRERWARYGLLWSDPVLSEPIAVRVLESPSFKKCK